jgi:hypothetical protein
VFDNEPERSVMNVSAENENEHDTIEDNMSGKKEDMRPSPIEHF